MEEQGHTQDKQHEVMCPGLQALNEQFDGSLRTLMCRPQRPHVDEVTLISIDKLGADARVRVGSDYSVERIGWQNVSYSADHQHKDGLHCVCTHALCGVPGCGFTRSINADDEAAVFHVNMQCLHVTLLLPVNWSTSCLLCSMYTAARMPVKSWKTSSISKTPN